MSDYRVEKDSLGEVKVPENALWGAQTQRAVDNFPVSGLPMPSAFIDAVVQIKRAAALANSKLGLLEDGHRDAIIKACDDLLWGEHRDQFPIDIYQTGSGTSTNMNVNEVIASIARSNGVEVNPNDHVNMSQSSNDVIPTAIHVSAVSLIQTDLLPALSHLQGTIYEREGELAEIVKTGRTHLMDAMPVTVGQELQTWREQLAAMEKRIEWASEQLLAIPQGGTAVGTGVNAHSHFADRFVTALNDKTGFFFKSMDHKFVGQSAIDGPVSLSGQLRGVAVILMKIANDLRWMNSGPIHGLAEISLPALQPGSSIMPGKVNPVIPESTAMVAAQVMGLDSAVAIAGQSGNFQLNVMLPLVGANLVEMISLLSNSSRVLADKAIAGFTVNAQHLSDAVDKNPVLVTALNPEIGYSRAAEIAKEAYASGRSIIDVAEERTDLSRAQLEKILDPLKLTRGGLES
ncbi:class II fumarate hydratase FumC [Marinobacter nanhaiticus D15-8W]|uniref:Fumarate hydratase class II n=1 Tax=Marinobacter nanhaiticus D15-8W TaxID=626887 RepID=N6WWT2_9GAMM|nr:class II fumarate hydratase [Marinobacter nanhaiticus]ENO16071.1 class II fumarate hydratase [Marinobacter nanhaiticus D15-8W]BES73072.1 class II fumarate hydratase FumC [Marinobacter nanhaiticus D15-8W]